MKPILSILLLACLTTLGAQTTNTLTWYVNPQSVTPDATASLYGSGNCLLPLPWPNVGTVSLTNSYGTNQWDTNNFSTTIVDTNFIAFFYVRLSNSTSTSAVSNVAWPTNHAPALTNNPNLKDHAP